MPSLGDPLRLAAALCIAVSGLELSAAQEIVPGNLLRRLPAEQRATLELSDPFADDWETESFERRAKEALGPVYRRFAEGGAFEEVLRPLLADGARATRLVPEVLEEATRGQDWSLRRGGAAPAELNEVTSAKHAAQFEAWRESFSDEAQLDLKVVSVRLGESGTQTRLRVTASGRSGETRLQHNATWELTWEVSDEGEPLRISVWRVSNFEAVQMEAGAPRFVDITASAFDGQGVYTEQLTTGLVDWQRRLDANLGLGSLGHEGLAIGDVNGDGLEDVYLCQPGGLPNRLFLRRPDGTTREVAAEAGVDLLDSTPSALILDFDGDGDRDLVTALVDVVAVFANVGGGKFEHVSSLPASTMMSLAAADYDLDGDLDIYTCGYQSPYADIGAPLPYHDANNGQRNLLLRNEGELRFEDVTSKVGLDENNRRFSFAASWEDYDDDGDPDLYVSNDFGRNNLYRNDGGKFVDVAAAAGVEDVSAGMGVSWGDYDGDGRFDLYVSNMYSSAGSRVAYQRRFQAQADEDTLGLLRRHARGNSLFRNADDGAFEDVTLAQGVEMGRWAWGSIFTDFTNDGRLDLYVPNGFATGDRDDDL